MSGVGRIGKYRNISHPAVAAVTCPSCGQRPGNPCRRVNSQYDYMTFRYCETHVRRVKLYEQNKKETSSTSQHL